MALFCEVFLGGREEGGGGGEVDAEFCYNHIK